MLLLPPPSQPEAHSGERGPPGDIELDYIVRFHREVKEGLREFGIKLHAAGAAVPSDHADKVRGPSLQKMKRHGPYLRPVCLFLFTMENDAAWYTWVAEPVVSEEGKPLLRSSGEPDYRPLHKRALKEIIERVDWWYDALFPSLMVNGPHGGKADPRQARQ